MRCALLCVLLATQAWAGRVESLAELAELYVEEGRVADALSTYAELRRLEPESVRWWRDAVGAVEGWPAERVLLLEAWHRARPDDVEAIQRLMYERELAGRLDEADALLDTVLRARPDDIGLWRQRAHLAATRGDGAGALRAWDAVVRHPASSLEDAVFRADALGGAGRVEAQREAYARLVARRPRDARLRARYAASLLYCGDEAGARVELFNAERLDPSDADVRRLRGELGRPTTPTMPPAVAEVAAPTHDDDDDDGALRRRVDFDARAHYLRADGDF